MSYSSERTCIVYVLTEEDKKLMNYPGLLHYLDKILKGGKTMKIDVEKITLEIQRLQTINAEEACAEQVKEYKEKVEKEFEDKRASRIHDLEATILVAKEFEEIEEPVNQEQTEELSNEENQNY